MAAVKVQVKQDTSKKVKKTKPRQGKPNPDFKGRDVPQKRLGCYPVTDAQHAKGNSK